MVDATDYGTARVQLEYMIKQLESDITNLKNNMGSQGQRNDLAVAVGYLESYLQKAKDILEQMDLKRFE